MRKASVPQLFNGKVQVSFRVKGTGRKISQCELNIPELIACQNMRDARRAVQKRAHAELEKEYGAKYVLKQARPQRIVTP